MLTRVAIRNLKGISGVNLALRRVTLFVGENGVGKSTILQALSILRQSKGQNNIQTNLPYANLGLLSRIVPPGASCDLTVAGKSTLESHPLPWPSLEFESVVSFDATGYSAVQTTINLQNGPTIVARWSRWGVVELKPLEITLGSARFNLAQTNLIGIAFQAAGYQLADQSERSKKEGQAHLQALQAVGMSPASALDRYYVIAPMRGLTEPTFGLNPQPVPEYTPRQGTAVSGSALAANLVYNPSGTELVSRWEHEILNVRVKTELSPGPTVSIQNPDKGTDFVNEGFGSNQLLFILERVANLPPDSTLAIEEPEIHLHPKAQFGFGKWTAKISKDLQKQFVITTHSQDLVSGVLAGVRDGLIPPDEVAVWFLGRDSSGTTSVESKVSRDGTIEGAALSSFVEASLRQVSEFFAKG